MAAQEELFDLPAGTWVLITQSGASTATATWSVKGHSTVTVKAMATETPPTNLKGSHDYPSGQGEAARALAELWPGITPAYLYANAQTGNSSISCSHAA